MKVETLQISWHRLEPVFSVDLHHSSRRLATGGADKTVKIWKLTDRVEGRAAPSAVKVAKVSKSGGKGGGKGAIVVGARAGVEVEYRATLQRHTAGVNCVRFSPDGTVLATSGDDGAIFLWTLTDASKGPDSFASDDDGEQKETWTSFRALLHHRKDVYDVAWSPCGGFLASCSTDCSVVTWNTSTGVREQQVTEHHGYIQGVAWDPRGEYFCSQSSDRTCRVYTVKEVSRKALSAAETKLSLQRPKFVLSHVLEFLEVPTEGDGGREKRRLFVDPTLQSFFRRCTWTPDGSFFIAPSGIFLKRVESLLHGDDEADGSGTEPDKSGGDEQSVCHTAYVFARSNLKRPIFHLPGSDSSVVACRASPVLYKYHTAPPKEVIALDESEDGESVNSCADEIGSKNSEAYWDRALPYRMVIALVTKSTVLVYDTEQRFPLCVLSNLHYETLTDATWSADGRKLVVSSVDGYCSVICFAAGELGEEHNPERRTRKAHSRAGMKGGAEQAPSAGSSGDGMGGQKDGENTDVDSMDVVEVKSESALAAPASDALASGEAGMHRVAGSSGDVKHPAIDTALMDVEEVDGDAAHPSMEQPTAGSGNMQPDAAPRRRIQPTMLKRL